MNNATHITRVTLAIALLVALVLPTTAQARQRRSRNNQNQKPVEVEAAEQRDLTQANLDYRAAQYAVSMVAPLQIHDLEQSPEYRKAVAAQDSAARLYQAARERVLVRVRSTQEWQNLNQNLNQILSQRDTLPIEVFATQAFDARTALTQLERASLIDSIDVANAQEQLVASANYVRDLRADCERSIRTSKQWQQAQNALASAKSNVNNAWTNINTPYVAPTPNPFQLTAPNYVMNSASASSTPSSSGVRCSACGKPISENSKIGDTCPHCGVVWGYDDRTNKK